MIIFLNELISDHQYLGNAEENNDLQGARYWKPLWQKLNLLRLHCQYRPENREVFDSIRGYDYLFKVVDERFCLFISCSLSSCDDSKEGFKEVGKIVDVIGFRDRNLPPDFLEGFVTTLHLLVMECDHQKIHTMVLRIYRRLFYDLNIETHLISRAQSFFFSTVFIALYKLAFTNRSDICNEDLYNGLAILKAAWLKSQNTCVESAFDYVAVVADSVNLCISRIHSLHEAAIAKQRLKMDKNGDDEAGKNGDETKNVELISVALEGGLWLINSIVTVTSSDEQRENLMTLQQFDIVGGIVHMVELVGAGLKWLGSPHLQFGINIVAALLKEEGFERTNAVARFSGDFFGSKILVKKYQKLTHTS